MTVTLPPPPQELLRVPYASSSAGTTTTGHGAALSTAWGGTFTTTASRPDVDIVLSNTYLNNSGANVTELHVLIDGTCILEAFLPTAVAAGGMGVHRETTVTGLAAGAHTIAVQLKVTAGTGNVIGTSTNKSLLIVRESGN